MKRDQNALNDAQSRTGASLPGDLPLTDERRAYLTARLADLLRELEKLERLETRELEPAMTAFPCGSDDYGAA